MRMDQTAEHTIDQTPSLSQRISLKATIDQHEALELSNSDLADYVQRKVNENTYLEYRLHGKQAEVSPSRTSKLDGYGAVASKPRAQRMHNHYSMLQNHPGSEHRTTSLCDYLLRQLPDIELDLIELDLGGFESFDRGFAAFLVTEIATRTADPNEDGASGIGMLPRSLAELRSEYVDVYGPLTAETAEATLGHLQNRLTPAGLGARTEVERVLLLLERSKCSTGREELGLTQPLHHLDKLQHIVSKHLPDLKAQRFEVVANAIGITSNCVIADVLPELQRLLQLSARLFDAFVESATGIVPEVMVRLSESDELVTSVSDGAVPRIHVPKRYLESNDLRRRINSRGPERKQFDEARRLVSTLEWRRGVLQLIADELIQLQNEFFRYGLEHLKPLTQRTLAISRNIRRALLPALYEALADTKEPSAKHELDEKITRILEPKISRALKDKWMDTPHGIYPIHVCFLDNPTWIKRHMKAIILDEPKDAPLSDEELAEQLKARSIDLKPDTVRKYRKKLGFESANKRRKAPIERSA